MADFALDEGVPIPPCRLNRKTRYPVSLLTVGASFFVPNGRMGTGCPAVKELAKPRGYQVTCRTVIEDGVIGVRVWRVE